MKKIILSCLTLGIFIISCKKDDDPVTPAEDKYMSIKTNDRWTYDVITDPGPSQSSAVDTVTTTGTDTSIGSRSYRIFSHSNGGTSDYYNISGNDYYRYQKIDFGGTPLAAEDLYLKDNQAAGTTWSTNVSINYLMTSIPLTITNKIIEKGISRTVNGEAYTDVISVNTEISSSSALLPPGSISSDITSYYARKVGLIEGSYNVVISIAGINIHTQTLLKTATIQ